jgi:serine/threonine protein phosphatase PrpC
MAWAGQLEACTLEKALADDLLDAARDAVYARAEQLGRPYTDLASTLLVAVLGDEGEALVAQVGDGALVIRERGIWTLALAPVRGEYANETFFITSTDAHNRLSARMAKDVDVAALCSDGLERLVVDSMTGLPHERFFDRVVVPIGRAGQSSDHSKLLAELLASAQAARLSDDDKAIVAAVKAAGPGAS